MTPRSRNCLLLLLLALVVVGATPQLVERWREPSLRYRELPPLTPGATRSEILGSGEVHILPLEDLPTRHTLHLVIEQMDLDLVTDLRDAEGDLLLRVDFPNDRDTEWLHWITPKKGDYFIHVRRYGDEAIAQQMEGQYRLELRSLRPANTSDVRRAEALQEFLKGYKSYLTRELELANLHYSEAVSVLELESPLPPEYILYWRELVRIRLDLEKMEDANRTCTDALERFAPLKTEPESSLLLYQCGQGAYYLGRGEQAVELFRTSLDLARGLDEPRAQAKALNGLGRQLRRFGHYGQALRRHQDARKLLEVSTAPSPQVFDLLLSETLMYLGNLQLQLGLLEEAKGNLQTALDIQTKKGSDTLYSTVTLARAQAASGQIDRAFETLNRAEEALRAAGQLHRRRHVLHARGLVARERGRQFTEDHWPEEAEAAYRSAIQYFQDALDESPEPSQPDWRYNNWASIGWLQVELEDPEAEEAFERALPLVLESQDPYAEAHIRAGWAAADYQKGELQSALESLGEALRIIESLRKGAPSVELRTSSFATWQDYYELYVEIASELFFQTRDPRFLAEGFFGSERGRARTLRDLRDSNFLADDLSDRSQERIRALQDQLTHLSLERSPATDPEHQAGPLGVTDSSQPPTRRAFFSVPDELLQTVESLDWMLEVEKSTHREDAAPPARPQMRADWPSIEALQQSLDEDSLLLSYTFGRSRVFLFAIDKENTRVFDLADREALEHRAKRFWALHSKSTKRARADHHQTMQELSDVLLGPVSERLKSRLFIVPSGTLFDVPFAALPLPTSPEAGPSDSYLIESHQIVQLPAATFFSSSTPAPPPSESALILGDPSLPQDLRLADLPATRQEVETIQDTFRGLGQEPVLLLGAAANRETFLASNPERFRIIHIASHSYPMSSYPELSAIVLSDRDASGHAVTPYLTPGDFFRLHLRADLVVLSACETALGDVVPGEGVVGFPYALFTAGAAQVLVSLWRVDDEATAELMGHFYRAHLEETLAPAAALRKAQLAMLRHPTIERWKNPYYWSAFILLGTPSASAH